MNMLICCFYGPSDIDGVYMPQENYLSPCDSAVIDYCQSFFSRTLSLCWQDLPANMQANRSRLFTLKNHFFDILNQNFTGDVNKHIHVIKTTEGATSESLISAMTLDMASSLTQASSLNLQNVQQCLNNSGLYNPHTFTPKMIATHLIKAATLSQFSQETLHKICLSFSGVFKERAHTFYSTLLDVINTAQKNPSAPSSQQHAIKQQSHPEPLKHQQQCPPVQNTDAHVDSASPNSSTQILTTYIQKFYCANLYIKPSHPVLHSIHQNIYTQLIDYSRSTQSGTGELLAEKSEIIRNALNALLALTTYPDTFFDQNAPLIHWKLEALSVTHEAHRIKLQGFFDDISTITHITNESELATLHTTEKNQTNHSSQHQKLSHHYARTGKIFNHVNSIVNAINDEPPAQEIHHFIQQYWQHVLLITGLQFGVDSDKWNEILTTLQTLVNASTMLACSQNIQDNILEHMQALGKNYLSFSHFLEQEGYALEAHHQKTVNSYCAS